MQRMTLLSRASHHWADGVRRHLLCTSNCVSCCRQSLVVHMLITECLPLIVWVSFTASLISWSSHEVGISTLCHFTGVRLWGVPPVPEVGLGRRSILCNHTVVWANSMRRLPYSPLLGAHRQRHFPFTCGSNACFWRFLKKYVMMVI